MQLIRRHSATPSLPGQGQVQNHTTSLCSWELHLIRQATEIWSLTPSPGGARSTPFLASQMENKPTSLRSQKCNSSARPFYINCTPSCYFVTSFLSEAGLKRNKEKISNLICLKPFLILSLPYSFSSRARSSARPSFRLERGRFYYDDIPILFSFSMTKLQQKNKYMIYYLNKP